MMIIDNHIHVMIYFCELLQVNSLSNVEQYLVTAYSLRPPCRLVAVNVPIQPRRRRLLPIFQVTKSGLKCKTKTSYIRCHKLKF